MMELVEGEVQVWRLDLATEAGRAVLEDCYAALSVEEKARAGRTRAGLPREEFIAGRGALRRLLGIGPEVALEVGAHGKPSWGEISFNVSHSRGLVLIALTRTGAVGVDTEYMDAEVEAVPIARASFHPANANRVEATQGESRIREFYLCWTRKEAVAKAHGRGITLEPVEFEGGLGQEEEICVEIPAGSDEICGSVFFVNGIIAHPQYMAALATSASRVPVRLLDFVDFAR